MRPQADFVPHVTTLGQGPRRALALHCSLAFGGAWAGVMKVLDQDLTLIAPDMPSHGASADWDEVSDFSDTVYQGALDAYDTEPMDLIGHSFGAVTALRIAACLPEQVRSLTLIEPVFFAVATQDAPETMIEHGPRNAPFIDALSAGNRPAAARAFNRIWGNGAKWDDLPERSRDAMSRAIHVLPDSYRFLYGDSAGMLGQGVLDQVTMPTILAHGSKTLPDIELINNALASRLPNASQVMIKGAGHMAPITHPIEVSAAISDLLARS